MALRLLKRKDTESPGDVLDAYPVNGGRKLADAYRLPKNAIVIESAEGELFTLVDDADLEKLEKDSEIFEDGIYRVLGLEVEERDVK